MGADCSGCDHAVSQRGQGQKNWSRLLRGVWSRRGFVMAMPGLSGGAGRASKRRVDVDHQFAAMVAVFRDAADGRGEGLPTVELAGDVGGDRVSRIRHR